VRNWLTLSALRLAIMLAPAAALLQAGTNPATITVVATPSPWDMTVPLNVQVTVSGAQGPGTGAIKLQFDNATIGTSTIPLSGGSAAVTIPDATYGIVAPSGLVPGTHTIGVIYGGDSNYLAQAGSSNAVAITIIPPPAPTSTTLSASATQVVIGQAVTFTAIVSSVSATGTVTLTDNGGLVSLGTVNLNGNTAVFGPISNLAQGSHTLVAQYSGDTNFDSSASNVVTVVVGKDNTVTQLTSPPQGSAANVGTPITMTALVTVQSPGTGTLSGSVSFYDGATLLGTQTLSGGTASFTTSKLPASASPHSLTAVYGGNTTLSTSTSAPVSLMINGLPTVTATVSESGIENSGQAITLSTTVTGPAGQGTPTGWVTFTAGSSPPVVLMDQAGNSRFALNSSGNASMVISTLSAGTHFIFANYSGDNTFAASSSTVFTLSICPSNATVTVTSSVQSPVYGQSIVFTGTVSPASPGSMDFLADGQSMLPTLPLPLNNGQAQFGPDPSTPMSAGAHTIEVVFYCGLGTNGIVSSPLNLIINSDQSITQLTNTGLQLTAVVLPAPPGFGLPTGSVQFMNGSNTLGSPVPLDGSTGVATATYTATAPGTITAVYSGDANFINSSSTPVIVASQVTHITISSSENPAAVGDDITFTATVTGTPGGPVPTGSVSFLDGTTTLASGMSLSDSGQAQFDTSALTDGAHTITAQFVPTGDYSSAQVSMGEVVSNPGSGGGGTGGGGYSGGGTLSVAADPQSPVYGQQVTLTATETPTGTGTAPTPGGQVTFQNGPNVLGQAAPGQGLSLNPLSPGTYNILATYTGDGVYPVGQATTSFTVAQASTKTVYNPKLNQTGQANLTATVTAVAPGVGTPTGTIEFNDASQNNLTVASATLAGGTASAIVDASIATHPIVAVYNGDTNFTGSSSKTQLQLVSTAANITTSFAPDEAVSAYQVTNLTGDTPAGAFPLPTSLAGASMKITDSTGVSWLAPLYGVFASASQINFVMPSTVALGPATVTAQLPGGNTMTAIANITLTSPAIFTANMNGQGVAAGQFVHVAPGPVQTFDNIAVFDQTQNKYVPNPVGFGPDGNQLYLVLYGTGFRHAAAQSDVTATVNGVSVPIMTAAQGVYPGLDQANLQLPNSLAGAGTVDVIIKVNGQAANTVQIALQ